MNQSAQGKLKSKYESSSRKIRQLHEEFENLRKRISTPQKNKREEPSFRNNLNSTYQKANSELININIPRLPQSNDSSCQGGPTYRNFPNQEDKTFLKNIFQKFVTCSMLGLDQRVDKKVTELENRLETLNHLFIQVQRVIKVKKERRPIFSAIQLKQMEQKYEKKLSQLSCSYEQKITLLLKDSHNLQTSDSSNDKKVSKQFQQQFKNLEQKLLIKDKEITELRLENTRLRRAQDQRAKNLNEKQKLIVELTEEINEKINRIKCVEDLKEKLESESKKQKKLWENKLEELILIKGENQKLRAQVEELEKQCKKWKENEKEKKQASYLRASIKGEQFEWNQSDIQKQDTVYSDVEEQMVNDLKIDVDDFSPLRHSNFVHNNTKNKPYLLEKRNRELEAELQLVTEENRLLKNKKDRFEDQCKENESDQQKFQMQSQLLKDELKRLNMNIMSLDECAVIYLKEKKVPEEKISRLEEGIMFKQEYFKKFPQRSRSTSKNTHQK